MNLERWRVGEVKKGVPARTWNAFVDMADRDRHVEGERTAKVMRPAPAHPSQHRVKVLNSTGAPIHYGTPVAIKSPLNPIDDVGEVAVSPAFEAVDWENALPELMFGIAADGAADGEVVPVVTSGLCYARLQQLNTDHVEASFSLLKNNPVEEEQGVRLVSGLTAAGRLAGLIRDSGLWEGETWGLIELGARRGVEIVLINSAVSAAQITYGSGDKISKLEPAEFVARLFRPTITGSLVEYSEGGSPGLTVRGWNFFKTEVSVGSGKAKLATLVDGVLTNVDCNEISYAVP